MDFQTNLPVDDFLKQNAGDTREVIGERASQTPSRIFQLPTQNAFIGGADLTSFWNDLD